MPNELKCADCKNWHHVENESVLVGQPQFGECRRKLFSFPVMSRNGQQGVTSCYPQVLDVFEICSHFKERTVEPDERADATGI